MTGAVREKARTPRVHIKPWKCFFFSKKSYGLEVVPIHGPADNQFLTPKVLNLGACVGAEAG